MKSFILKLIHIPPYLEIVCLVAYCGLIFFLSSRPSETYPNVNFPHSDKIAHIILYLPLGILSARIAAWYHKRYTWAFLFCLLYGISDEFHQHFVPTRNCSVDDIFADCLGGLLGIILFHELFKFFIRKHPLSLRKSLGGI